MKKNILIMQAGKMPLVKLSDNQLPSMPDNTTNFTAVLSRFYNVFQCGYDWQFDMKFSGTFYYNDPPIIQSWHNRPFIYTTDHEHIVDYRVLNQLDAMVTWYPPMQFDAKVAGIKCLVTLAPVNLDFYKDVPIRSANPINRLIVNRYMPHDMFSIARIILSTGFKCEIYGDELVHGERDRLEWLGVKINKRVSWYEYAAEVTKSFAGANIHVPITYGKIATITAWCNSVTIGYPQPLQKFLYPLLTSYDPLELRNLLLRLQDDNTFFKENAQYAKEKLYELDFANPKVSEPFINFITEVIK